MAKNPRTIETAVVRDYINSAMDTIRATHREDPHFCIGYMWATLTGLLEKCGEPIPTSLWEDKP